MSSIHIRQSRAVDLPKGLKGGEPGGGDVRPAYVLLCSALGALHRGACMGGGGIPADP
jgi:hypothetical protein